MDIKEYIEKLPKYYQSFYQSLFLGFLATVPLKEMIIFVLLNARIFEDPEEISVFELDEFRKDIDKFLKSKNIKRSDLEKLYEEISSECKINEEEIAEVLKISNSHFSELKEKSFLNFRGFCYRLSLDKGKFLDEFPVEESLNEPSFLYLSLNPLFKQDPFSDSDHEFFAEVSATYLSFWLDQPDRMQRILAKELIGKLANHYEENSIFNSVKNTLKTHYLNKKFLDKGILAETICQIGWADDEIIDYIIDSLISSSNYNKHQQIEALGSIKNPNVTFKLKYCLKSQTNLKTKGRIINALAARGDDESLKILKQEFNKEPISNKELRRLYYSSDYTDLVNTENFPDLSLKIKPIAEALKSIESIANNIKISGLNLEESSFLYCRYLGSSLISVEERYFLIRLKYLLSLKYGPTPGWLPDITPNDVYNEFPIEEKKRILKYKANPNVVEAIELIESIPDSEIHLPFQEYLENNTSYLKTKILENKNREIIDSQSEKKCTENLLENFICHGDKRSLVKELKQSFKNLKQFKSILRDTFTSIEKKESNNLEYEDFFKIGLYLQKFDYNSKQSIRFYHEAQIKIANKLKSIHSNSDATDKFLTDRLYLIQNVEFQLIKEEEYLKYRKGREKESKNRKS